jgi:hypothetical protein
MSIINARYVDTCLSDYLQDSYSRPGQCLAFAPLGLTREETAEALFDSLPFPLEIPESITDEDIKDAFFDEIFHGVDLRYIDGDGNRCDETPEERPDCEEPYLYVVLEWAQCHRVSMRLTVDVDYIVEDPGEAEYELKQILENLIRHAAGDGALSGSGKHYLDHWGATALPREPEG